MLRIREAQVIMLHSQLIALWDGLDGMIDDTLLSSALSSPFQCFGGAELYPTIQEKAARLAFNLIRNQIFIEGNLSIGILIMLTFLEMNGVYINCTDQELVEIGTNIASGKMNYEKIVDWVFEHEENKISDN